MHSDGHFADSVCSDSGDVSRGLGVRGDLSGDGNGITTINMNRMDKHPRNYDRSRSVWR
jgi:hypothetical protein